MIIQTNHSFHFNYHTKFTLLNNAQRNTLLFAMGSKNFTFQSKANMKESQLADEKRSGQKAKDKE